MRTQITHKVTHKPIRQKIASQTNHFTIVSPTFVEIDIESELGFGISEITRWATRTAGHFVKRRLPMRTRGRPSLTGPVPSSSREVARRFRSLPARS